MGVVKKNVRRRTQKMCGESQKCVGNHKNVWGITKMCGESQKCVGNHKNVWGITKVCVINITVCVGEIADFRESQIVCLVEHKKNIALRWLFSPLSAGFHFQMSISFNCNMELFIFFTCSLWLLV